MKHIKIFSAMLALSILIGIVAGLATAHISNQEDREARNYCMEVEQGAQDQMDQGFINCVTPDIIQPDIDEEVENKSEVRCVCRRKVGEAVETLQITTADAN